VLRGRVQGELAVVGIPHGALGQVVCAVLTREADLAPAATAARAGLDGPQRPRRWFHRAQLPATPAGKLDRAALAELVATGRTRRLDPGAAVAAERDDGPAAR
jgi:acyl-coenzyme A synthetase/AMP-(fatty) acid ligase